jgi:excisionase family DNA binding protein
MKLLSAKEASSLLSISVGLVYGLIAARKIRHERHGLGRGRILIPEDALEEYRRRCTVEADEAASVPSPPRPQPVSLKHLRLPS